MDNYTVKWVFLSVVLTLMLALNILTYMDNTRNLNYHEGDPFTLKKIVSQLAKGLSEVNLRHEKLSKEIEKIAMAIPKISRQSSPKNSVQASTSLNTAYSYESSLREYDLEIVDYALESAGGRILDTGETTNYYRYDSLVTWALMQLTTVLCKGCDGARAILQPSSLPGECWAFKGNKGEVIIQLLGMVVVTGISLEHIPAVISPTKEISTAPRTFELEGLANRYAENGHYFGKFEYKVEGKPIQYFSVSTPSDQPFNIVRVRFLSNWGNPTMTCVYRIRIHGDLIRGPSLHVDHNEDLH